MNKGRKILVLSGTRADYGLLRHVIKEIHDDSQLQLQLVVTGTHLSPKHNTVQEIEADGIPVAFKIPILSETNDNVSVVEATSKLMTGLSHYVSQNCPDIFLVLGDRYEMFGAATVALIHNIPLGHIHGGELTFGAIDDAFRHAMTKMSWLHFTSAEEYRKRVIHLGESPERVFNVGAPVVDSLNGSYTSKEELEEFVGIKLQSPVVLVTLHPETQSPGKALDHVKILCEAIKNSGAKSVVFTKANADAEGNIINSYLESFVNSKQIANCALVTSLGQKRYLSMLQLVDAGVGNSSSLVIEAPMVKTPSVNIGRRQEGRVRFESILDVPFDSRKITEAINRACTPDFKSKLKEIKHPFGEKGVAKRIVNILRNSEIPTNLAKGFYE